MSVLSNFRPFAFSRLFISIFFLIFSIVIPIYAENAVEMILDWRYILTSECESKPRLNYR